MLEEQLERIATALEKLAGIEKPSLAQIAAVVTKPNSILDDIKFKPVAEAETLTATEAEELRKAVAMPANEYTKLDRDAIIKELESLGVKVAARQRTAYLASILEKKKAEAVVAPKAEAPAEADAMFDNEETSAISVADIRAEAEAEAPKVETPKAEAPKVEAPKAEAPKENSKAVSIEEARALLKDVAVKHGVDKAKELLARFKAVQISQLSPEQLFTLKEIVSKL